MKKTFLDLVCLQIRMLACLMTLSILSGCAASYDELNVEIDDRIGLETFVPKGLSTRWGSIFAFTSDSIGYAATNYLRSDKYVISKTSDRGRTWEQQYSAPGICLVLKSYEDKVYYSCECRVDTSVYKSEIGFIDNGRRKKILSNIKGRVYSMNVFNDSTLTYTQDVSIQKQYRDVYDLSDSTYLSTDSGKTWRTLFTDLNNVTVFGYDSSDVHMRGYLEDPAKYYWIVSDINTDNRRVYDVGWVYTAYVDDGLLMKDSMFYRCDDNVMRISTYYWNGYGFMGHGPYNAWYFAKSGKAAFAYATQFPGKENREDCIFYSIDNGYNWKALSIGHGLIRKMSVQTSAAKIPSEVGLSVIYQDYSDSLRIVNIRPDAEMTKIP